MSENTQPDFGAIVPQDSAPTFNPEEAHEAPAPAPEAAAPAPDGPLAGVPSAEAPAQTENTAQPGQTVGEAGVQWTGLPDDAPAPDYALPQRGEDDETPT